MAKEKKNGSIKEGFDKYKFILKIFAAVILLAFAIIIFIQQDQAVFAMLLITGGVALLAALVRLILLLKKDTSQTAKIISLVEGLLHVLLGGYMVVAAFMYLDEPTSKFSKFNNEYYLLILSAILYSRVVAYFWQVVIHKAPTTPFMFWTHIVFTTLSVVIAAFMDKVDAKVIVIVLGCIAILCALIIGGEAGGGYYKYRKSLAPKEEVKEETLDENPEIEAPSNDEDTVIDEIDPSIIPIDDTDQDSSVIS